MILKIVPRGTYADVSPNYYVGQRKFDITLTDITH